MTKEIHVCNLINNVVILLGLLALFIGLVIIEPYQNGFYCNDFSINMINKHSTVTNTMLYCICIPVPIVMIILIELVSSYSEIYRRKYSYKLLFCKNKSILVPRAVGNCFAVIGMYLFGLVSTGIVTYIGKKTVGRLRPNFLDVCDPQIDIFKTLCDTDDSGKTFLLPNKDFMCNPDNAHKVKESRLSFPSGHSSFSFYFAIFLILYINRKWNSGITGLLPQLFQLILFSFAFFTALSRIIDNKHHPTDVLAGSIIGILIGATTSYYLDKFLRIKTNINVRYPNDNDDYRTSTTVNFLARESSSI